MINFRSWIEYGTTTWSYNPNSEIRDDFYEEVNRIFGEINRILGEVNPNMDHDLYAETVLTLSDILMGKNETINQGSNRDTEDIE